MQQAPSLAEIAEMKSRGYDPLTLAEAERLREQSEVADGICVLIEEAFTGVTLGKGGGLRQAQGLDDYADADTCGRYRAEDEKEDWRRIPIEALNACNSSLSFFDAEGMRFHLPAFLVADLRGDYGFGMAFCLTHLSDYNLAQFSLLSPMQRAAVRSYLLFIVDDQDYAFDREHIQRALDVYWTETSGL